MSEFDAAYGYDLARLLSVGVPPEPADFQNFWQARFAATLSRKAQPQVLASPQGCNQFHVYDLSYQSTEDFPLGGWLLLPKSGVVKRGVVVGHGYGGREGPDLDLPIADAALLFPCFRGLSRSRRAPISDDPNFHVLHDIDKRDQYILGKCVEDLWLAVSALLELLPELSGHVGYLGISFSGGLGALALPWDARIQRAHLNVPTFGNHPLRMTLPTWGSGKALQDYQKQHCHVLDTLAYYDAAVAARHIRIPMHIAAALADPVVAPPGQFSIYNALSTDKHLFVLDMGHAEYPAQANQRQQLLAELQAFFAVL